MKVCKLVLYKEKYRKLKSASTKKYNDGNKSHFFEFWHINQQLTDLFWGQLSSDSNHNPGGRLYSKLVFKATVTTSLGKKINFQFATEKITLHSSHLNSPDEESRCVGDGLEGIGQSHGGFLFLQYTVTWQNQNKEHSLLTLSLIHIWRCRRRLRCRSRWSPYH